MDFWPHPVSPGLQLAAALLLALLVDRWLGEPPRRWHPVVWMGSYLGWAGRHIAPQVASAGQGADIPRFVLGALAWGLGAAVVVVLAVLAHHWLLAWHALAGMLVLGLLLKPLLAWRMLREEVQGVESALSSSLPAGREQLARLVSRDVQALDASQVRESAIESLAENLNDSLVAPLFWFALLGLPGATLYRYANTADAMWGYRGLRAGRDWTWAGKWAARADDVLSWLPARLTALLLVLARGGLSWCALRTQAPRTPSPNSGWPMAAMALALDVRLAKPGVYVLHEAGRCPEPADTARAVRLGERVVLLLALVLCLALLSLAGGRP